MKIKRFLLQMSWVVGVSSFMALVLVTSLQSLYGEKTYIYTPQCESCGHIHPLAAITGPAPLVREIKYR
jgi:hypothetical protein